VEGVWGEDGGVQMVEGRREDERDRCEGVEKEGGGGGGGCGEGGRGESANEVVLLFITAGLHDPRTAGVMHVRHRAPGPTAPCSPDRLCVLVEGCVVGKKLTSKPDDPAIHR